MTVSYSKLSRYINNPARAYAHYVLKDKTAYPIDNQEALVYGRILHSIMAGEDVDLSDEEKKIAYKYGNEERGLKASFESIKSVEKALMVSKWNLLNSISFENSGNYKSELPFENDTFNGRFDFVDYENKIIIDWKTVSPRIDFDKAWSDRDGTYTSWIHSTMYDIQAFIYLYSIIQETGFNDWKYYVIAASKSYQPKTRVIDMDGVMNNFELRDLIENTLQDIDDYETGKKQPPILNDKSDWYETHKPFSIEVY